MEKSSFFIVRLWIVVALILATGRSSVETAGDVWDEIKSLEYLDGEAFKRVVNPLVEMTANAYRYPGVIPIPGWTLVDAVAPVHGGMHAVVYQDDRNTARMVIAFRGTDITGSKSSRADICADEILWFQAPVPAENCSEFSSETLDYYKQAVDYTREMLEAYPQASFLMSGHSLGAALAILATATFNQAQLLRVVAFCSPGTKTLLERMSLTLTKDQDKKIYIVADKWDEVMRLNWEDQIGTLCLYQTTITKPCIECFDDGKSISFTGSSHDASTLREISPQTSCEIPDSTLVYEIAEKHPEIEVNQTVACLNCFFETHYLKHVIDLVELGNKPVCEFRGFIFNGDLSSDL